MNSFPQDSTIVLVHGAWADGSCWKDVILPLERQGLIWMPEDGFRRAVAHKASTDQTKVLGAVQRPISVRCIQEAAPAPGWKAKPSWFLLAEEDRMINPKTQEFMATRMGAKIRSSRVDHSPMYTATDLVIQVILDAGRESLRERKAAV